MTAGKMRRSPTPFQIFSYNLNARISKGFHPRSLGAESCYIQHWKYKQWA